MGELGIRGFESYLSYLEAHPKESQALADRMLVTVTRFYRDRVCWERLAEKVLRPAVASGGPPFRAWCAGCCGGEEPYSLVLLWRSLGGSLSKGRRLDLTATDIDRASLERAAAGRYGHSSLREVPEAVRAEHFSGEGEIREIDRDVTGAVTLRESNLMDDPSPANQDLVLCRYLVFTYYRGERRLKAARRLFSALGEGGILFTGKKEGLGPKEAELFDPIDPACGIYRKREHP
jgi:chemotaxis methyl-accepting protein methylase